MPRKKLKRTKQQAMKEISRLRAALVKLVLRKRFVNRAYDYHFNTILAIPKQSILHKTLLTIEEALNDLSMKIDKRVSHYNLKMSDLKKDL